jgi:hypothetical protein
MSSAKRCAGGHAGSGPAVAQDLPPAMNVLRCATPSVAHAFAWGFSGVPPTGIFLG